MIASGFELVPSGHLKKFFVVWRDPSLRIDRLFQWWCGNTSYKFSSEYDSASAEYQVVGLRVAVEYAHQLHAVGNANWAGSQYGLVWCAEKANTASRDCLGAKYHRAINHINEPSVTGFWVTTCRSSDRYEFIIALAFALAITTAIATTRPWGRIFGTDLNLGICLICDGNVGSRKFNLSLRVGNDHRRTAEIVHELSKRSREGRLTLSNVDSEALNSGSDCADTSADQKDVYPPSVLPHLTNDIFADIRSRSLLKTGERRLDDRKRKSGGRKFSCVDKDSNFVVAQSVSNPHPESPLIIAMAELAQFEAAGQH